MTRRLQILNELRPASEGFAGIPQETRLLHTLLLDNPLVETVGLLNGNVHPLGRAVARQNSGGSDEIYWRAASVLDLTEPVRSRYHRHVGKRLAYVSGGLRQKARFLVGAKSAVYPINLDEYADFLWHKYFAKSLSIDAFDKVTRGKYAVLRPSWSTMQIVGLLPPFRGRYGRMDTSAYDVMVSQGSWPAMVSKGTQIVVRYHDAIPMFYPHTIHNAFVHQFTHYYPLKSNLDQGARIVCNSENSRTQLLKVFPSAEPKTSVIPCIVSDIYRRDETDGEEIGDIIGKSIEPSTAAGNGQAGHAELAGDRPGMKRVRFIMMVSTIEPRKNHARLIAAWNRIRMGYDPDLRLVIVGVPGWNCADVLKAMQPLQQRGQLFNISRVPAGDLRKLYGAAKAVICPSFAEGFDLSGIEAMLSGGAVAASDIPVHHEVYGEACEYFNPYSTNDAANAILRILKNEDRRQTLVERGLKQGALYTRDRIGPMWTDYFDRLREERLGAN